MNGAGSKDTRKQPFLEGESCYIRLIPAHRATFLLSGPKHLPGLVDPVPYTTPGCQDRGVVARTTGHIQIKPTLCNAKVIPQSAGDIGIGPAGSVVANTNAIVQGCRFKRRHYKKSRPSKGRYSIMRSIRYQAEH